MEFICLLLDELRTLFIKKEWPQSFAAATLFSFSAKEAGEQFASETPVLGIDAVLHLGQFNSALDQSCLLQLLQVLGNGCLGDGQLLMDGPKVAVLAGGEKLHDGDSGGVPECLGYTCQALLPFSVIFLLFHMTGFVLFAKLQTIRKTPNKILIFLLVLMSFTK